MEIQNLRAFVLVAETGSFSVAAEKLHLTQPAVSKRVALLEQQLNSELFDRIGRQMRLTEAGEALLPHAKQIEQQLLLAEQSVRDLAGEVSGTLRLATSHHIGLHRLPPVLSQFSADYPAVIIDIDFMDSERAYELVTQGKIELAVVTLSPDDSAQFTRHTVWRDPLKFMVAPEHELAQRPKIDMAALASSPAVLPGLNTYTGQIVKTLFYQHGLELNVSIMTNYLETIRMMASVGLGWTMLPANMRDHSLVALDVEGIAVERLLGFVYHRGRSLSRAAAAFITCLEEYGDR
ncbi:MAG: DNA-binding transcriptional LysR family regulator [Halieaceae bacterium]|jgi:DNA-binding transcriptional LysR family regulator